MKNRIFAALLSAAMLTGQVLYLPVPAMTELTASANLDEGRGQIGSDIFWEYDFNGTLTIYGNGEINASIFPWNGTAYPISRVVVESGVTNLPEAIFEGQMQLSEVHLCNTITSIGANAFRGCTNLHEITLPDSLRSLSGTVFDGTSIRSLTLPASLTTITDGYFKNGTSLNRIDGESMGFSADGQMMHTADGTKLLWYAPIMGSEVTVPEGVTEIGEGVFRGDHITRLSLPATLKNIGSMAFDSCMLDSVTFTGTYPQWKNLVIAEGNEPLSQSNVNCTGSDATENWMPLDNGFEWMLEDGVLTVVGKGKMPEFGDEEAFPWYGDTSVTEICIGEGITSIAEDAFAGMPAQKLTLPVSLESIGFSAFEYNCFTSLDFRHLTNLLHIEGFAFACSDTLTQVQLPDSLTDLYSTAFSACPLTALHLPAKAHLEEFDYNSFWLYQDLTSLTVDPANPYYSIIDNMLCDKAGTTIIRVLPQFAPELLFVPERFTAIGPYAFRECDNLVEVYLPDHVTQIGEAAFAACSSISYFRMPKGMTVIPESCFSGSYKIRALVLPEKVTEIQEAAFSGLDHAVLYTIGNADDWSETDVDDLENWNDAYHNAEMHFGTNGDICAGADLNGDNVVNAVDAAMLLRYAAAMRRVWRSISCRTAIISRRCIRRMCAMTGKHRRIRWFLPI